MDFKPVTDYVITPHAFFEMKRRGIDEEMVRQELAKPQQYFSVRPGRIVTQSKIKKAGDPKEYLLRIFIDTDRHPAEVVIAYCTSKVLKYWQGDL